MKAKKDSLYDIVAHPDEGLVQALRDEIAAVLKETNGVMTSNALFRMKLLDSVMRESQRVNPLSMGKRPAKHQGASSSFEYLTHHI